MKEKETELFKFSSVIAYTYIFAFFFFTDGLFRFTDVFFEPTFAGSRYIDDYDIPSFANYSIYFTVIAIIIILFAISAYRAKKGSTRATLITLGFLSYLMYTSIFYIYFSYEEIGFFTTLAFVVIFFLSFYELGVGMSFINAKEIKKRISHKYSISFITILFFTVILFFLLVSILEISLESPDYWAQITLDTIFSGKAFEVAPLTSFQVTPFILAPVLIVAIVMFYLDLPRGYVLALILLVMWAIQSVYILKIVSFVVEYIIASNEFHEVKSMHLEDIYDYLFDINEITNYVIKEGLPWVIKIFVSLTAGVIAFFFLKNIPGDIMLRSDTDEAVKTESTKDTD